MLWCRTTADQCCAGVICHRGPVNSSNALPPSSADQCITRTTVMAVLCTGSDLEDMALRPNQGTPGEKK